MKVRDLKQMLEQFDDELEVIVDASKGNKTEWTFANLLEEDIVESVDKERSLKVLKIF